MQGSYKNKHLNLTLYCPNWHGSPYKAGNPLKLCDVSDYQGQSFYILPCLTDNSLPYRVGNALKLYNLPGPATFYNAQISGQYL